MIWKGTKEQLDNFNKDLNEKHPTIKFEFEIWQKQVNFLAANKEIKTKLYTKEMDTHTTYVENPPTLKKTIPYGQALRVEEYAQQKRTSTLAVRTCTMIF